MIRGITMYGGPPEDVYDPWRPAPIFPLVPLAPGVPWTSPPAIPGVFPYTPLAPEPSTDTPAVPTPASMGNAAVSQTAISPDVVGQFHAIVTCEECGSPYHFTAQHEECTGAFAAALQDALARRLRPVDTRPE